MIKKNEWVTMVGEQINKEFLKNAEIFLDLRKRIDSFKVRPNIGLKKKVNEDNTKELHSLSDFASIKQLLDDFLLAVENDDPDELEKKVKNMKIYITKMFSVNGDDPSEIYKILNQIPLSSRHFTSDDWRLEKYLERYKELYAALDKYRLKGPLKGVFEKIESEIQCTYQDGMFKHNMQSIYALWEYYTQLYSLERRVITERFDLFELYKKTLVEYARFLPLLITLQPVEKENKTLFHRENIKDIADAFIRFSKTFAEFLTAFDNPYEKQNKKTEPEQSERNLKEI